ncbi:hypothetical protein ACFQ0B_52370 [Nonomuraea thailandensis]
MRALRELAGRPDRGTRPRAGKELRLDDFMDGPPEGAGVMLPGVGLLSGNRYLLPAEVVWLERQECRVEPATSGVVDHGVAEAIAEIFAHDVVARWWADPRRPLLRVSEQLDRLLPPGVMAAATGLGLRVSAFVLSAQDASVALVTVGGDAGALAVAADRTVKSAVSEAFLLAMASRAQPWHTLPLPDSMRRFAVWHREGTTRRTWRAWPSTPTPRWCTSSAGCARRAGRRSPGTGSGTSPSRWSRSPPVRWSRWCAPARPATAPPGRPPSCPARSPEPHPLTPHVARGHGASRLR